ncbi:MAG: dihydroorotate dehydrogenase electron transfer subunit [Thermoguttaceae bacterium]
MPFCNSHPLQPTAERLLVAENVPLGDRVYRIRLKNSAIAQNVQPGQFVMLRLPNRTDPLLGRPLAVYRTNAANDLELVYFVVGRMTARLAEVRAGEELDVWGPLGLGFKTENVDRLIMVAGGIGQTPMLLLSRSFVQQQGAGSAVLLFGARTANRLYALDDFRASGLELQLATEDGSAGHLGRVTDLIPGIVDRFRQEGAELRIKLVCCGPHAMLKSAFEVARSLHLPCDVSLETPMSCGMGICFGCVVALKNADIESTEAGMQVAKSGETVKNGSGWDYARTCVEGPVFDAYRMCW